MTDDPASPRPPSSGGDDATTHSPAGSLDEALARAQRSREQQETGDRPGEQVAEILGRLRSLTEQVEQTAARHADLAAAVSEELAPQVAGLHQAIDEAIGQLRSDLNALGPLRDDVDELLAERKQREKTKNAPVDWAALTEQQAAAQWPILARWVGDVLVPRYELTRDDLPDCWALHYPVVAELSWLRTAYVQAYLPRSTPQLGADWHTKWRPAVLKRIRELIKPDQCSPGKHSPQHGPALQVPAQNGALPRAQLATPECWWPFYDRAFHLDLAVRRARAAAGAFDWTPDRATA